MKFTQTQDPANFLELTFDKPIENKTSSTNETSIEEIKNKSKIITENLFDGYLIKEVEEIKQFYGPKRENEFTARVEAMSANGVVKIKFSEEMKD